MATPLSSGTTDRAGARVGRAGPVGSLIWRALRSWRPRIRGGRLARREP